MTGRLSEQCAIKLLMGLQDMLELCEKTHEDVSCFLKKARNVGKFVVVDENSGKFILVPPVPPSFDCFVVHF